MNRKICLFSGTDDGVTKQTIKDVFPNSAQVICRPKFSFVTFETVTEALLVLKHKSINVAGVDVNISWSEGCHNPQMLLGQLEREKEKAVKEQAQQNASQGGLQPQNVQVAAAMPVGPVALQPVTVQYVSPQQGITYQGNYAPGYQLVGHVVQQPAPMVNQNVIQGVPLTVAMQPTTTVAFMPSNQIVTSGNQIVTPGNQMGQQPLIPLGGVPGYMQSNAMIMQPQIMPQAGPPMPTQIGPVPVQGPQGGQYLQGQAPNMAVAPQMMPHNGPPMTAQIGPLPGQMIASNVPQGQGQFFSQQAGTILTQGQFFAPNNPTGGQQ